MSNIDESIGKILLELQKDNPDTFKKLMENHSYPRMVQRGRVGGPTS